MTRVYLPNLVRVASIRESPSGEISVTFEPSHARHVLKPDPDGEALLRMLREAERERRWLAVTVNDRQEILDARPYDRPFELPRHEPPPPRAVWWHWWWWPWNWFRRYSCVSRRRAQELFDLGIAN